MQLTPAVGFIKLQTLVPLMQSSVFPFIKVFIFGTRCLLQGPALVEFPQVTLIVADCDLGYLLLPVLIECPTF